MREIGVDSPERLRDAPWGEGRILMNTRDVVTQIRRATRRRFTAEEKIRMVLEGLRGEVSVSDLCRREGIAPTMYYRWSKAFLEAGKNGLLRDTQRDATTEEVRRLKQENTDLKKALAEAALDVVRLKKSLGM
jgi:transposase